MTLEKKLDIFKGILVLGDIWGKSDQVEMLNRIWNLHLLSSEDPRYKDAYGDAVQHLRNNSDWDEEYVFLTRFGLLKASDDIFFKFLNEVVSTKVRVSKDEIQHYVEAINLMLEGEHLNYILVGEDNGLPVYEIGKQTATEVRPLDIPRNQIRFFVDKKTVQYPCFTLSSDNWDDYGRRTTFDLTYWAEDKQYQCIGTVKIMTIEHLATKNVIPTEFTELSNNFCSLGQNEEYYAKIKGMFPESYRSIMFALRDAAYFSVFADSYQHTISFQKSLLRSDNAQRAFRNAHCILEGIDLKNRYSFTLQTKIPCYDGNIPVELSFGNLDDARNLDRVKALIGENGAGKSSILFSLAEALHNSDDSMFENGHRPDFSKVIAISYSIFDNLFQLTKKSSFNFVYCGLRNRDNELLSEKDKKERLKNSLDEIVYKERVAGYFLTLIDVVDKSVLLEIFQTHNKIDKEKFLKLINKMSSGQAMITSIITEIYAHIRENSLILFDEPEVHLHANAITKLTRIIFNICNEFKSACIVATHSAVILQELLARNVLVVEQNADTREPYVRGMNTETLGENLTTITEDIFGRSSINKHYGYVIHEMIKNGMNGEQIEQILKTEGLPMSMNLYMYIRRQLEMKANDKL